MAAEAGTGAPAAAVSVVVVTFNSADTLEDCLRSVPAGVEVIVAEQGSDDGSADVARAARPDARIVHAGANRGFGAGCNLGAANSTGDVVVFLNPDAQVDERTLEILAAAAREPGTGLVGPTIIDGDGADVTHCRRWSSPLRDALNLTVPLGLLPRGLLADIPPSDPVYRDGGEVPYVQGSCMAIRKDVFFALGGFDEEFFIYGEEEWLAHRLVARGLPTRLVPAAQARHIGATSTVKTGGFAAEQLYRARVLMYHKRAGALQATYGAALLLAALSFLLVTTPLRTVIRFRPRETAAWCRSALRGVVSGWRRSHVVPPGAR